MSMPRLIPECIEGRHVLLALLGFFGIMFLVNGIFLYYAVGTFNGFETRDAYRTGLNYNARIASDEAQASLGWRPLARYEGEAGRIVVEVRDTRGRAVAGLSVSGEVRRPATDKEDNTVVLAEVSPGRYEAPISLAAGRWVLSAQAFEGGRSAATFRMKQRLWVRDGP